MSPIITEAARRDRETRKHLRGLGLLVRRFIEALDVEMKQPVIDRKKIAGFVSDLDMEQQRAMRFGLDLTPRGRPIRERKPAPILSLGVRSRIWKDVAALPDVKGKNVWLGVPPHVSDAAAEAMGELVLRRGAVAASAVRRKKRGEAPGA